MPKLIRKIKYEAELDRVFSKDIASTYYGEMLFECIQCGTCSGICPMSVYMDYTPRRIIAMTREGFKKEVIESNTIWICSSCYSCTVNCPKDIKITEIMYALKRYAIKEGTYPKGFPPPIMANEFMKIVEKSGRNSEMILIMKMGFKRGPWTLVPMAPLGASLFFHGRLPVLPDKIENRKELKAILDAIKEDE